MARGRPKGKKNLKQKVEKSKSPVRNEDEDEDFKGPVETFSQKIEKKKFSSTLFTEKGHPLSFYVAPSESKDKLTEYIQRGGGTVEKFSGGANVITLVDVSSGIPAKVPGECFSFRFIYDSILADKIVDISKYRINLKRKSIRRDSLSSPRKRILFTNEDDEKIIQFVNKNSQYTPASSKLWQLAEKDIPGGHTWQSMRSRYLKVIRNKDGGQSYDYRSDEEFDDEEEEEDEAITTASPAIAKKSSTKVKTTSSTINNNNNNNSSSSNIHGGGDDKSTTEKRSPSTKTQQPKVQNNVAPKVNNDDDGGDDSSSDDSLSDPVRDVVLSVINNITITTKLPRSVVVHGLIVNNGVVSDTIQYLHNPKEFYSSRSKSAQIWSYAEDKMILDHHPQGVEDLRTSRGETSIENRRLFLES